MSYVFRGDDLDLSMEAATLEPYLGRFKLSEPKRAIERRVEEAVDAALAPLSLALRLIGKPLVKAVAFIPEELSFSLVEGRLRAGFGRKLVLTAALDGPPVEQKIVLGWSANVLHRMREGALETYIYSEAGSALNRYELSGDQLVGSVHLKSPDLPREIRYSVHLARV